MENFTLFDTIKIAWEKVKGTKGIFWGIFLIMFLFDIINGIMGSLNKESYSFTYAFIGLIAQLIGTFISFSLLYLGIQRAFNRPIAFSLIKYGLQFSIIIRMIGLFILQYLIMIPFLFLFIAPIFAVMKLDLSTALSVVLILVSIIGFVLAVYVMIRLAVANAFILDQKYNPIKALKSSFRVTKSHVLELIGIAFINFLILLISAIPLGIGLIWSFPYLVINFGEIYKKLVENART